jgi:YidC/Oxa1 family membrane protein insertase
MLATLLHTYHILIYQPLLNALIFLYQHLAFQDLGVAIVLLTFLIRLILFPLFQKSAKHQALMQRLQPKLKELQQKHKGDLKKQSEAMNALYREHRINPFTSFLLLLVQLPILIALYQVFLKIFSPGAFDALYSFVRSPGELDPSFLGLLNLKEPSILIVLLTALAQYFQGKLALPAGAPGKTPTPAEQMSRRLVFIGPAVTALIFWQLPAAVTLYWLVSSSVSVLQQLLINRQLAHGTVGNIHQETS